MGQTVCNFLQCNMLNVQIKETMVQHMSQTDGGGGCSIMEKLF